MLNPPTARALQYKFPRAGVLRYSLLHLVILLALIASNVADGRPATGVRHAPLSNNAGQGQASAAPQGDPLLLTPNAAVKRSMRGGEVHEYKLELAAGQCARVVVEQSGVDVAVKLSDADGRQIIEVDSPNGRYGPEAVTVVARVTGSYSFRVVADDKTAPPGEYELRVEGPRETTSADEQRAAAELLFAGAQNLRSEARSAGDDASKKYKAAIEKYEQALVAWRDLGDARDEGYAYCNIGRAYRALGMLAESLDAFKHAVSSLREAQDQPGEAFALNEEGATYRQLGDPFQALDSYKPALELRDRIRDVWGQAQIYNNIGLVYSNVGYQPKAIETFDKALALWRQMADRPMEMNTLNNAAQAYAEMGDVAVAFDKFQEVLKYCDQSGNTYLKPYAVNGLGLVYDTWGEQQEALVEYSEARDLFHTRNSPKEEADVLDNIGMAYAALGDPQQAIENFRKALALRRRVGEPKGEAVTLSNIGYAYTLIGDHRQALKNLGLALPLCEKSRDRRFEAYTIVRTGTAYVSLGEPLKALELYRQALQIQQELEDIRGQAITLDRMGEAFARAGESSKALDSYGQALRRWEAVSDRQGQALSLYGAAAVSRDLHDLRGARDRIEQAIGIVESLRSKMTAPQLRMTYFAGRQDFYATAIDVRMRLYELTHSDADLEAALSYSEQARARSLLDLLTEARADIHKGMSTRDQERNRQLDQEISALSQNLLRLRSLKSRPDAEIKASIEMTERRQTALIREQEELQTRVTTAASGMAQTRTLGPREIQQLLDDDTVLLEYSLGEGRSYLWAVTRNEVVPYTLPGRAEVERAASQFREAITAFEPPRPGESDLQYLTRRSAAVARYKQLASELSDMVLARVWERLGSKRLVIVADGALQYVPFEALPVPGKPERARPGADAAEYTPLIAEHEVLYQPSASTLSRLRAAPRPPALKKLAVLADPVFDSKDERVHTPFKGVEATQPSMPSKELGQALRDVGDVGSVGDGLRLERLSYTADEAKAITADAPPGSWLKAVDFDASRATAMSQALGQYAIVHFATHGILNDKHPELSGIILSMVNERGQPEDGFLSLRDIYNLDLPVDLVVLSACRTGIGKQVRGEGLIGLTRGFMHAGAGRVVASLWKVQDEATAEFMKRFYHNMLVEKMPAAAAMRQAKVELRSAREEWRAPYYWAGFILQGDWK
jgi:CHAT domain-containing protein/Tfp pilus assembly protein PilF